MSNSQTFDEYLFRVLELDSDLAGELADARAELDQVLRHERVGRPTEGRIGQLLGYVRQRFGGGWMWQPIASSTLIGVSTQQYEEEDVEPSVELDEATNQLVIEAGPHYGGGEALLQETEGPALVGQVALDAEGRGRLAIPEEGTVFQVELIAPDTE
jgi:hypothetical protein